ncbi:MAG: hypothetical protein WB948_03140 [Desulfobaccales bacterium]
MSGMTPAVRRAHRLAPPEAKKVKMERDPAPGAPAKVLVNRE